MNEDTGLSCGRLKKKNTSLAYKWGFELIRSCERMIKDIYAMSGAFSMWLFAARFFQKSRFQIQNYPKVSQSIPKYQSFSTSQAQHDAQHLVGNGMHQIQRWLHIRLHPPALHCQSQGGTEQIHGHQPPRTGGEGTNEGAHHEIHGQPVNFLL